MITRLSDGVSQESNTVATEVFIEIKGDLKFRDSLSSTLRCATLNTLHEKVEDFRVMHALDKLPVNFAKHEISLLVLEWIM